MTEFTSVGMTLLTSRPARGAMMTTVWMDEMLFRTRLSEDVLPGGLGSAYRGGCRTDDPPGRYRYQLVGIFIVVAVEMAQITPPIGFNLIVLQGMTHHQRNTISKAAFPMFLIMALMVFILMAVPELAAWLPEHFRQRQ